MMRTWPMTMTDDTDTMKLDPKIHVEIEAFLCAHFFDPKSTAKKQKRFLLCIYISNVQKCPRNSK